MPEAAATPTSRTPLIQRPVIAGAVLLMVYAGLSLLNSTGGYLGTDTGAKVATIEHMVDADSYSPAVGYWAEEWDPGGAYHPLFDTLLTDRNQWVNVTTLPMLVVAKPLYDLGGYRLALLLPMLGAIGAAFACRSIARQLGDHRSGHLAFWVVGLASPMTIYALDFWEHSVGAALMVGSVAGLLRVVRFERDVAPTAWLGCSATAGLALGAAATMRTETLVFAGAAVGTCGLVLVSRGWIARALGTGLAAVAGFAVPWLGNALLESRLGGNARADRVSGAAGQDLGSQLGDRVREAGITWFGLPGLEYPSSILAGTLAVLALVAGVVIARRGEARSGLILSGAGVAVAASTLASSGLSFVPGALLASPVAIFAMFAISRPHSADEGASSVFVIVVALGATVGIWLFQFVGGAGPQWGGRYILGPTLLLTSLGSVALARSAPRILAVFVGLGLAVTVFGAAWLSVRSHEVDHFFDRLADRPEDVVISTNGFLVREAGPAYDDRRYLSLGRDASLTGALEVARNSGAASVGVLTDVETLPALDAAKIGVDQIDLLGVPLYYHRLRIDN